MFYPSYYFVVKTLNGAIFEEVIIIDIEPDKFKI